jgi:hypothetical protein
MPAYLPAEERIEIIRQYAHDYEISVFVESGTALGATVEALLDEFSHIITIELDPALNHQATVRFGQYAYVSCLLGDSGELIPRIVPTLTQPTIFWLDGHYCGGARGDIDTPIVDELTAAVDAPHGSVILIDDARLFDGMPDHTVEFADYPPVWWVKEMAANHNLNFLLQDDIMRLTPQ